MGVSSGGQGSRWIWEETRHTHPNRPSPLLRWDADGVCSLQARACRETKPGADVSHRVPPTAASRRRKLPNTISVVERRGTRAGMRRSPPPSTSLKKVTIDALTSYTRAYTQYTSLTGGGGRATAIKRKLKEPNGIKRTELTPVLKRSEYAPVPLTAFAYGD